VWELEATPIPGTENGHSSFFSPDGNSLGFHVPQAGAGPANPIGHLAKVAFPQGGATTKNL
jgi:hypothetical protein